LTKANGAIEMDTTGMTLDEQVAFIVEKAKPYL
jgi:cytidylate kinase